ncbi:MAG: BREX system ATP-binding domain-containing protein [Janthinobacterium lividum]
MNAEVVTARSAIESLRSGVPSRHAAARLGTTQRDIQEQFQTALSAAGQGIGAAPLVISANFGAGKSHLLGYLASLAERENFVTSYVVISPEMPLGYGHLVLKAIAETAHAPNRTGKALPTLMADLPTASVEYQQLRDWARESKITDRFNALLTLYQEFRAEGELRSQILLDFEGKPLLKTLIRKHLKEIGQAADYDLSTPANPLLAHDRIRLLAQAYRAGGCRGLVVLFDEVERIAKFSLKQRIAAYKELDWWRQAAEAENSFLLPVFATARGFLEETVTGGTRDAARFVPGESGYGGIDLLKQFLLLDAPTREEEEDIKYRVKGLYEEAYGIGVPALPRTDVRTSIRSEIRRWIAQWDILRFYPDYRPQMIEDTMQFDSSAIADEDLAGFAADEPEE